MGNYITGVSTSRVSNLFAQQMLMNSIGSSQVQMANLELAISSGQRFQLPGQDPSAAQQVTSIQSLLLRKTQFQKNIDTTTSYLGQTDSTLSSVSSLLTTVRSAVNSVAGSTVSDAQRQAVIDQINSTINQVVTLGNQQFNGEYLFAGSATQTAPFSTDANGHVIYSGNAGHISTQVDVNTLFTTNVSGAQAFGAVSPPVSGVSLQPAVSENTALADLNGGKGVGPGAITISDGHSMSTVDLSGAATLGDVATLIRNHPPAGRTLDVEVTATGLTLRLQTNGSGAQDNLSVKDLGGTVAASLGISRPAGVGAGPLVGDTLQPALTAGTSVGELLGTRARGYIHFGGQNNDIVLEANSAGSTLTDGTALNGVSIQVLNDAPAAGQETAQFTPGIGWMPGTLTVHIAVGASRGDQIVSAINQATGLPFTARIDTTDTNGNGQSPVTDMPVITNTSGGSGTTLDQAHGLQIASGGKTYTIDLSSAQTVQDVLSAINTSGAGVKAEINSAATGINVSSYTSGADFAIGENGGTTAQQLGLRTFTDSTLLNSLNHGLGVGYNKNAASGAAPGDFTITQVIPPAVPGQPSQTIAFTVDISKAQTIGDVENAINTAAQAAGSTVNAALAEFGNGIELDAPDTAAQSTITVTANQASTAAVDLGLIPKGQTSAVSSPAAAASGSVSSGPNSGLVIQANDPGYAGNVQVMFQQNPAIVPGGETVNYDIVGKTLTFQISPQSTANDVLAALKNDALAGGNFTAMLDTAHDPTNDGSGVVQPQSMMMAGGKPQSLVGADVATRETPSIFTALSRLSSALTANDSAALQQAASLLDTTMQNLNSTRAELGVHEQSLSSIKTQVTSEQTSLQATMSDFFDTDMAKAISDFTAQQTSYQASLAVTGKLLQMTLLSYL